MRECAFVTFADGDFRYKRAAARLVQEAKQTGLYSDYVNLDLAWLKECDPEVYDIVKKWYSKGITKGVGFWIWKSSLLIWAAKRFPDKMIHYLDAGHVIFQTKNARETIASWMLEAEQGGLAWHHPHLLTIEYSKREVLERFDPVGSFWQTGTVEAGFIMMNASAAMSFGNIWRESCLERDGWYLSDELEKSPFPEFKAHRHDQSIFSILWKQSENRYLPSQTYPLHEDSAIYAARHASGYSWSPYRKNILQLGEFHLGKLQKAGIKYLPRMRRLP